MAHDILLDSGTNEVEILEFFLGGQSFGINVAKVMQIVAFEKSKYTDLPDSAPDIPGVYSWRDKSVSVIDLNVALKRKGDGKSVRPIMIITYFNSVINGFLVDGVNRIHRISWDNIDPSSSYLEKYSSHITGSININEKDIMLVDFEYIISTICPDFESEYGMEIPEAHNVKNRENVKLVFAEDSGFIRAAMTNILNEAGYGNIEPFENGFDAYRYILKLFKKSKVENQNIKNYLDIIISDIEMPKMDGLTLCKKVKRELALTEIPVVIFSSLVNEQMAYKCDEVGADAYTTKPQSVKLVQIIDKILGIEAKG